MNAILRVDALNLLCRGSHGGCRDTGGDGTQVGLDLNLFRDLTGIAGGECHRDEMQRFLLIRWVLKAEAVVFAFDADYFERPLASNDELLADRLA